MTSVASPHRKNVLAAIGYRAVSGITEEGSRTDGKLGATIWMLGFVAA